MFLTDRQILSRLGEFQFEADNPEAPFDPGRQIGPCSVDLRLSRIYWTPRGSRVPPFYKTRTVDLDRTRIMDLSPTRGWRSVEAKPTDHVTIKPGHMVLARVSESFQLPSDCAGLLEGRSSYARLGLSVHSTGGFVNPGWRGHMPLTLFNHGPVTLRIPIGTPLCQLLIVQLVEAPEADYAQRNDRKYVNDQGGPSYWWRDVTMREIQQKIAEVSLDARAFEELDELLPTSADELMIGRLEDFLSNHTAARYGNATELLDGFAKAERRGELIQKIALGVGYAGWTVTGGGLLAVWLGGAPLWAWIAALILTAISVIGFVWALATEPPVRLTPTRLRNLQHQRDTRRV